MKYFGVAFCVLALIVMSQATVIVGAVPQVGAVIASVVLELTNIDRSAESLEHLKPSEALTRVAQAKAKDMAEKGYFAHTSPDGLTPWHWFKEEGYTFMYAGENLAVDFSESADVERAWMNSPTHRANIVGSQFTEIGIGVATGTYNGRETTFVVQSFGTPAPGAPALRAESSATPAPDSQAITSVAVASTVTDSAPQVDEVLGDSAGAYLKTSSVVPWWYQALHFFF